MVMRKIENYRCLYGNPVERDFRNIGGLLRMSMRAERVCAGAESIGH